MNTLIGLAAPAIAHGLGALAPTMGTLIPAVGGGLAAAATATGSAAGSVAVAASFGGVKEKILLHMYLDVKIISEAKQNGC